MGVRVTHEVDCYSYLPTSWRVLNGILQKVQQHLLYSRFITSKEDGQLPVELMEDLHSLLSRFQPHKSDHLLESFSDVEVISIGYELSLLYHS